MKLPNPILLLVPAVALVALVGVYAFTAQAGPAKASPI